MTSPSNPPPATVALFRRSLDGFHWHGSYSTLGYAHEAAASLPGIYELREVPSGRLIDTLNTYGSERSNHEDKRRKMAWHQPRGV
jgi:hypothetical protein